MSSKWNSRRLVTLDLDEYDAPERPDFRRIGRGKVPYVLNPEGKRVRYGRSSNGGKILDDESNLTDWKLRTVAAGAAQRPELMAEASTLDVDSDKRRLREIAEECLVAGKGQRRAVIGSAVHAMFDHLDRNDGWKPPPNFVGLCNGYVAFREEWGLETVGIEIHCINDEYRLAGTLDRRYRTTRTLIAPDGVIIPIGSIVVGDFKTGKELEYSAGSYTTQLAAYVGSLEYDVATDERTPFDPPNYPDWALIIHADSAGTECHPYWVDVQQGREGLELAQSVKGWRRRDGLLRPAREPLWPIPPNPPDDRPAPVPGEPPTLPPAASRTTERAEHLRERVRAVLAQGDLAARQLQRDWPTGVPGLKVGGHTWDQLDAIERSIARAEADHSVPFGPSFNDPVAESMARHPSTNKRGLVTTTHPRINLVNDWFADLGSHHSGVITACLAFADLATDDWPDNDVETMLVGALRGLGFTGVDDLPKLTDADAGRLLQIGFAIAAGETMLLFDAQGNPVVRVINER
jgi:hypothetical protein